MPYLWNIEEDGVIRMACNQAKDEIRSKLGGDSNKKLRVVSEYFLERVWKLANFRMNVMVYHPREQTLERFLEITKDSTHRYFIGKYYGAKLYEDRTISRGIQIAVMEFVLKYDYLVTLLYSVERVR